MKIKQQKKVLLSLFGISLLMGAMWNLGTSLNLICIHILFPIGLALIISFYTFEKSLKFKCLLLLLCIVFSEIVRICLSVISDIIRDDGTIYFLSDFTTRLVFYTSLTIQIVLGLLIIYGIYLFEVFSTRRNRGHSAEETDSE